MRELLLHSPECFWLIGLLGIQLLMVIAYVATGGEGEDDFEEEGGEDDES